MIRVSLSLLIFIYLFLLLTVIFATWAWHNLRKKRLDRQALRFRLRCTICALEFTDESTDPLPRCPRCGSLNERLKFTTF